MSICNDLLAEFAMQDIIGVNSARAIELFFNISFDIKSIVNFYAIGSIFPLPCHYFEERKNPIIEDNTSHSR